MTMCCCLFNKTAEVYSLQWLHNKDSDQLKSAVFGCVQSFVCHATLRQALLLDCIRT